MNESPKEKLERLKREYTVAKQALDFKKVIAEKRDQLENSIQELKKDIENGTFKLYRKNQPQGEELKVLSDEIEKSRELLKSVTKTRRELDAKLDEFELFSAEMLSLLKEGLVEAILELYPQKAKDYNNLTSLAQQKRQLHEVAKEIEVSIDQLAELISIIVRERQGVRKKSILSYIFGPSPNYTVTKSLNMIREITEKLLNLINKHSERLMSEGLIENISSQCADICRHLQYQSTGRWGWKKIDVEVVPYQEQLEELRRESKKLCSSLEAESQELKNQLEEWIEKNS